MQLRMQHNANINRLRYTELRIHFSVCTRVSTLSMAKVVPHPTLGHTQVELVFSIFSMLQTLSIP